MTRVTFPLILGVLFSISTHLFAQCPFDEINCTGLCGRFTDENKDGYCDYTILKLQDSIDRSVQEENVSPSSASNTQNNTKPRITAKPLSDNTTPATLPNDEDSSIPNTTTNPPFETMVSQTTQPQQNVNSPNTSSFVSQPSTKQSKGYRFITFALTTLGLYALSFTLWKKKIISKQTHLRIWNVLLLLTFILSALLGLVLTLQINYGFGMSVFRHILRIHVEFGVAMAIIGIIHCLFHLAYYKRIFSSTRPK